MRVEPVMQDTLTVCSEITSVIIQTMVATYNHVRHMYFSSKTSIFKTDAAYVLAHECAHSKHLLQKCSNSSKISMLTNPEKITIHKLAPKITFSPYEFLPTCLLHLVHQPVAKAIHMFHKSSKIKKVTICISYYSQSRI